MYTNINTDHALFSIKQYLRNNTFVFRDLPIPAIMDALNIIMRNTIFQFGDTWWVQKSGTAMGAPPAPPYTTIYYGIHEQELLNKYRNELFIYKRFIDDIFGIWIPSTTKRWQSFCSDLTYGNLQWEVSPHSTKVDFMDLTIRICNNRIVTTLFEKELNLYLYLPPHSAHPPGVLHGLVIGNILRINNLCSQISDRNRRLKQFYQRLLFRGYKPNTLLPIFDKALRLAQQQPRYVEQPPRCLLPQPDDRHRVYFHLPFHPQGPSASQFQRRFKEYLLEPRFQRPYTLYTNLKGASLRVYQLIVAYSHSRASFHMVRLM